MFTINGKTNSYYGFYHTHTEIASPAPKRSTGSVPLADGIIDFTALLSPIQFYEARQITLRMETTALRSSWLSLYGDVMAAWHGVQVELSFDNDPGYYWVGYATVGPLEDHGASAGVTITVQANPFKRSSTTTELYNASVLADLDITATVTKMRGYISTYSYSANATLTYDGQTWTLPSGSSEAFGLILPTGSNTLTLHGDGSVLKVYLREATL